MLTYTLKTGIKCINCGVNDLGDKTYRHCPVPLSPLQFEIKSKIGTVKINFIVDTSASLSILPLSIINRIMIDLMPVSLTTKIKCFCQADQEIGILSLR